uniref:Uncharacterized protein n=1 Tax=Romanomermis culicivorax TaxID=13658 RepID=A0A915I660_ROMCU
MSKILQFLIPFVICVTSTKAFTTCRLTDGRLLRNGTSAFVSCDTKCTCLIYPSYYHVLCEATCLGNVTTSGCSLVRKPGDFCCVRQNQCPTDVKLDQCLTVNSTTEDRTIPWHIRIKNDGVEKCAGVMVPPSRSVITKMGCANENSILIGNNGKTYAAQ